MECTKCFQIKELVKGAKWCKDCKNEYERNRRSKNKEKINKKDRKRYQVKKKNVKEIVIDKKIKKKCTKCKESKTLDQFHLAKNKGTIRAACKECSKKARRLYYQKHKKEIIRQTTEYQNNRRKTDPGFKMKRNLRSRLYSALKSQNARKSNRTLKLTGCTVPFLMGYIESKFKEGMTWENYGTWHMDHIYPCSKFDLTKEEEQRKCFHYTNLQPLWASENISKKDEIIVEKPNMELKDEVIEKVKLSKDLLKKKKCKKACNQNLPKYIYYRETHGGKYKGYVVEHPNGNKRFSKKIHTLDLNLELAKAYLMSIHKK